MVNSTQYKRLFEPGRIGQMQLKNRIVMPPMGTGFAEQGQISQRQLAYYEARARGGAGLIIIEVTAPGLQCHVSPGQPTLGDDRFIASFQRLADAVHKHGAKIAVQLQHSSWEMREGKPVQVSPSAITVPFRAVGVFGQTPHELTTDEIGGMVQWFTSAAKRAREAGLDGVEVHGAHQYLVASFLSSATNVRQDRYGGTVENKARFLVEILEAIKGTTGADYPVWVRLNAQEFGIENGVTMEETKQVVPMAVDAGAEAIHASGYGAGSSVNTAPIADTPGALVTLASEIKKVTSVPVIAVGRMDHELGERVLEEGKADLIAIGRRLMADPDLPNKVAEGRLEDINPCIGCAECLDRPGRVPGEGTSCTINAAMGREREYQIQPAGKIKKVVVVGGGPAGMEAARVAALRGHRVELLEKESELGGQLKVASIPPHKDDIAVWVKYLVRQVEKAGVKVRLNTEATTEVIERIKPDAIVIASGGVSKIPGIPGAGGRNVITAQDALSGKAGVGQNVVIIGGGIVGCETGHYLAEQGKGVTVIEILERMATEIGPMLRKRLMDGLRANQVTLLTRVTCEEISEEGVRVTNSEGKEETIQADTIILAVGYEKNDSLFKALEGKVAEVYCIGDSSEPQRIMEAVNEGYRCGLSL